MKRSEMVKIIAKKLCDESGSIKENTPWASEILIIIENDGMLPPNCNYYTIEPMYIWESEK